VKIAYDKTGIGYQMLVDLPFTEMSGLVTYDRAKAHHELTLTGGAAWASLPGGAPYLDLSGGSKYLQCPGAESADVNFTNGDFTFLAWVYNNALGGAQEIVCQGAVDVDGFEFYMFPGVNTLALRTSQLGSHTGISAVGAFIPSQWHLAGVTRHGASGQFYINGDVADTIGTLIDPVSCAGGNKLLVGIQNNEITNGWDGYMGQLRIWGRELNAMEMKTIFQLEHSHYGV